ncbi:MAG TPA: hypothetical protein VNE21_04680 [Mycobacteriales bacterium]|nr:hypothetical protein [Mycobacteriales bacterium]
MLRVRASHPSLPSVRDSVRETALPRITSYLDHAVQATGPGRREAADRGRRAWYALSGRSAAPRPGWRRQRTVRGALLAGGLLAGIAGVIAVVRLRIRPAESAPAGPSVAPAAASAPTPTPSGAFEPSGRSLDLETVDSAH